MDAGNRTSGMVYPTWPNCLDAKLVTADTEARRPRSGSLSGTVLTEGRGRGGAAKGKGRSGLFYHSLKLADHGRLSQTAFWETNSSGST